MYKSKFENPEIDGFFEAVLTLRDTEDCYRFFEDICTVNELKAIAQRLEVAKMLNDGVTFNAIAEKTGASSTTISRVNRCLRYGADGYKNILERLKDN